MTMSDYDVDDDGSNDVVDYDDGMSDEGKRKPQRQRANVNSVSITDTEDASETDMLKYDGEYTEIKEQ